MKNIIAFALVVMTLFAASFFASPAFAADKAKAASGKMSCSDCARICDQTLTYMQKKGGKYTAGNNVQTILDCIQLCKASANLEARKSPNTAKLMEVCHKVCMDCAKMCRDLNDPKLAECVKACEECHSCCE